MSTYLKLLFEIDRAENRYLKNTRLEKINIKNVLTSFGLINDLVHFLPSKKCG